jgi:uncharacterized protein (TIGR02147 family)
MMKPKVFLYSDYKKLLNEHAKAPEVKRGYLKELAEASGCQRSYFSSVLHTHNHLTPDQAFALTTYWNLSNTETEYFLVLVDLARAGGRPLRERLLGRLQQLRTEQEDLSKRLERPSIEATNEGEFTYYSSWIFSAVHILTSIPQFQTAKAIAAKLNIPEDQANMVLSFLKKMNLVEEVSSSQWKHSSASRHVGRGSPLVSLHHNNWRQRAVLAAQLNSDQGVHFTSITAMTTSAFEQIKMRFLENIEHCNRIAGPSECERLVCFEMDLFQV